MIKKDLQKPQECISPEVQTVSIILIRNCVCYLMFNLYILWCTGCGPEPKQQGDHFFEVITLTVYKLFSTS